MYMLCILYYKRFLSTHVIFGPFFITIPIQIPCALVKHEEIPTISDVKRERGVRGTPCFLFIMNYNSITAPRL